MITAAGEPKGVTPVDRRGAGLGAGDLGYVSLWVSDADQAAAFFTAVLGWSYTDLTGPGNRLVTGQSLPQGLRHGIDEPSLFCCYAVVDLETALERVGGAGGTPGEPMAAQAFGRMAMCVDDQGGDFGLVEPSAGISDDPPALPSRHGDLAYVTYHVVDADAFRAFYGSVLDWRFVPGHTPGGWQIEGLRLSAGLMGGHERAVTIPFYAVDDIAAAGRVRSAGGTASEPVEQPYASQSLCVDGQGTTFYLGQFSSAFDRFRVAALVHDVDGIVAEMSETVEIYNPASAGPTVGKAAALEMFTALNQVFNTFENVHVLHEQAGDGAERSHHAVVFRATVGTQEVEGVDLVELENDQIVRFTVIARPIAGLMAIGKAVQAQRESRSHKPETAFPPGLQG